MRDAQELVEVLSELDRRKRSRKMLTYFPDTGPLRRELYPKHLSFFEAGRERMERAAIAANRVGKCVAADTLIESPDGPARRVADITGPHRVWAWDGKQKVPAWADEPFTKPAEMIYRVWLASGRYVDCAADHRFLGAAGWTFLSSCFPFVPCLPESTEGLSPSTSLEDALCLLRTTQGSPGGYRPEHRLCDAQPLSGQGIVPASFPSRADARTHSLALSYWDALASKCKHIFRHIGDRLSSLGAEILSVGPFAAFPGRALCSADQRYPCLLPECPQSGHGLVSDPRSSSEDALYQSQSVALVTPDGSTDTVVCYQPIGVQPIYDFHVPHYENYCTAGLIHHNTTLSAYETALHLTGRYPSWWAGRRFDHPVEWWAASDTGETTRDILQLELMGKIDHLGTGMIPKECIIGEPSRRRGVADAIDTVRVRHSSGGESNLAFKSYDQGRQKFQGTKKHGISLDEEPDMGVYTECLTRLMATVPGEEDGVMICTFTPLKGMSAVVLSFLNEPNPNRFVLTLGFDDAPHLSEESKAKLLASFPPHERDARSKGTPQLGSGAIYPVPESEILVDDFAIPEHWPRAFGQDVGWNRTAAIWGALNRETDTLYLFAEHYRGQAEPAIHAQGIRSKGDWIPGVIDPASRGRSQHDGTQLVEIYKQLGLNLEFADNSVEAGIYEVWSRMSTGRLKVFRSLNNWLSEFRLYRRDEKGRIVKESDHLMDATRYLAMSGIARAKTKPAPKEKPRSFDYAGGTSGWMG